MALVCFDTNFIVWGIKQEATEGQEHCIPRARHVIRQCQEKGDDIMVPSIVLGELLSRIPDAEHHNFIRSIERMLHVVSYDVRAAISFSRMWKSKLKDDNFTRSETKADFMIAATAVANACACIYSNDSGLKKFAEAFIPVITIDEISIPTEQLYLYQD